MSEDHRPASPAPSSVSMRSDCSKNFGVEFKEGERSPSQIHKSVTSVSIGKPPEDELLDPER
ncbi:hypothetical protein ILYODFUR_037941, partial [Ilyodon furcidens]